MPKRRYDDISNGAPQQQNKKQHIRPSMQNRPNASSNSLNARLPHQEAVEKLPPQALRPNQLPGYIPFTVPREFPELPLVLDESLAAAPFKHKSVTSYNRGIASSNTPDISYERLEFLGDAYLEIFASRLIFSRFSHLPAGQMSQLRELLVKNETLCEYARGYGFDKRVTVGDLERMQVDAKDRGNKGFNKVMGDVFEAYIAAVILSDLENGVAIAEQWMTALWAPKLHEASMRDRSYGQVPIYHGDTDGNWDPQKTYNPSAKADLQRRIMMGCETKLSYEPYKDSIELKGDQLGQNRHFIALYLTGYGHERKLLGKGEGKNKVEAGNWAATEAMYGKCKALVDECEREMKEAKAKRTAERAAEEEKLTATKNGASTPTRGQNGMLHL